MVQHRSPSLSAAVSSKDVSLLQHCLGSSSPSFCHMPSTLPQTVSTCTPDLMGSWQVTEVYVREMLFADDAALTAHSGEALQRLVDRFAHACREFGLTFSLKKTNVIARDASQVPSVNINDYTLEVVEDFTYLGSNISNNLSLDTEINRRIGKAHALWPNCQKSMGK